MGIRYYAYAVEADRIDDAIECPSMFLSCDPLADAWGMEGGVMSGPATMKQVVPKRDMLYLDKAWDELQELTRAENNGGECRPSYRMFEGRVRMVGPEWEPWVRVLRPEEMRGISWDLKLLCQEEASISKRSHGGGSEESMSYLVRYLQEACRFAEELVEDGRGMVYMIG
ncbi:DUF1877 domain-containing protein [Actinomyces viscosus]|nr:DUF1877 domain-containing protein [Actinomyces viscosus]TFH51934.1 DUF1877 domain-containing protein [Actinomyces viscosus]